MTEVILDKFTKMAEEQSKIKSFSWANVYDLLLRFEGVQDLNHEDVVMACGEGFAFAYSPYHYAPMYLGLKGSGLRLRNLFGYSIIWLKGPAFGGNIDQAWDFIKRKLDEGHGIHVEGPESFLIYGYKDPSEKEQRILKCIAKWGLGLDGDITWEEFSSFPAMFSYSSIVKSNAPLSEEENIRLLVKTMNTFNSKHPGIGSKFTVMDEVTIEDMKGKEFELSEKNYGIKAFESFIDDVNNDDMIRGMLQAYLYCHAMNFQIWGRRWQSKWFAKRSKEHKGKIRRLFDKVADAYREVADELQDFVDTNEKNREDGKLYRKVHRAIDDLKKAYKHEKIAVEALAELTEELEPEEPMSLQKTVKETLFSGMGGGDTHMSPFSSLEGINEEILHIKPAKNIMSIWEQLTHLHFWNELGLQNLKEGKPHWSDVEWSKYPPDYLEKYGDWQSFHKAVIETMLEIQQIIMDADDVNKRFPEIDNVSFAHMARFLCSHMSYHIAQIVMTRKLHGDWPPAGNHTPYHLIG
ncbi:MAG: DinB family protein [Asgard group archaeon]|nr:DinB family protein [Asgard group archaeon]